MGIYLLLNLTIKIGFLSVKSHILIMPLAFQTLVNKF